MRVALVHDWLTGMRGGEKCLEVFCELYPEADLFTLLHRPGRVSSLIEARTIRTSFIQHLPLAARAYRYYLPLFPTAIEQFDLRGYDLILSSSHCVAKGIIPAPTALHIAYLHTPMRYVWDLYPEYFGTGRYPSWVPIPFVANYLRMWDVASSARVDYFVANSAHVARRIRRYYGREATVIHPPVDTDAFRPREGPGEYYLVVSAFAPYKRIDLAVEAFRRLGRPLKIVGTGQDAKRLRAQAGPGIEFLGECPQAELAGIMAGCRALVFPGEEDFGLTPVEAQACGRPVIAYGRGGVVETVVPIRPRPSTGPEEGPEGIFPTGVFFSQQTPAALAEAVEAFERHEKAFDSKRIRDHALRFDRAVFKEAIATFVGETLAVARC